MPRGIGFGSEWLFITIGLRANYRSSLVHETSATKKSVRVTIDVIGQQKRYGANARGNK
jgi:hypothetical protein